MEAGDARAAKTIFYSTLALVSASFLPLAFGLGAIYFTGAALGGFLFIAVSGLLFVSIGVLASSVTSNQSVAGILGCVALATLILGGNALSDSAWLEQGLLGPVKSAIDYAHVFGHRDDFARGVIDTRHLLFYASGTALSLIFSILSVEAKLLHA